MSNADYTPHPTPGPDPGLYVQYLESLKRNSPTLSKLDRDIAEAQAELAKAILEAMWVVVCINPLVGTASTLFDLSYTAGEIIAKATSE